jgi:hypothetical protein
MSAIERRAQPATGDLSGSSGGTAAPESNSPDDLNIVWQLATGPITITNVNGVLHVNGDPVHQARGKTPSGIKTDE